MSSKMDDYRQEINAIDEELYKLYKKRLNVSRKVGTYKKEHKLPVLDAKREEEISLNLQEKYRKDVDLNAYLDLHETMMRVSRNAQYVFQKKIYNCIDSFKKECCVGYQGDQNLVSLVATNILFPKEEKKTFDTFPEVFEAIESGDILYGIVPLENSAQGEIAEVFNLLREYKVVIVAEIIQPLKNSETRFIIIAKQEQFLNDAEKTSVLVTINHKSGTLAQVVAQFHYEKITILKISSRQVPDTMDHYQFFIDFDGGICDEKVQRLLQRLQAEVYEMRLLGSYPIFESH